MRNEQTQTEQGLLAVGYGCNFDGGRYRIRTYDFHRVKVALYR